MPDAAGRRRAREALGLKMGGRAEELVFLVTVDCLRADRLSCNGNPRPTTPAMDALAAAGVNFPRAYSVANQTAQSFPGIMLSNFFANLGGGIVVPEHLTTLAEVMRDRGFHTAGLVAANPLISHFCGYDRGFAEFCDFFVAEDIQPDVRSRVRSLKNLNRLTRESMMSVLRECEAQREMFLTAQRLTGVGGAALVRQIAGDKDMAGYYDASELLKEALGSLLKTADSPKRFYWLHFMDVHEPITVPFSRLGRFTRLEKFFLNHCAQAKSPRAREMAWAYVERYRELYDAAVSYVDLNLEVLCRFLTDHGLMDRTLLCVTADHGQELLEHGIFGHAAGRAVEELLHVPLAFGGGLARRVNAAGAGRPVSSLDIAPTILDVCGIEARPHSFLGVSLNDSRPRPVHSECMPMVNPWDDEKHGFYLTLNGRALLDERRVLARIEGGFMLVHHVHSNETRLERLPGGDGPPPDADGMLKRLMEYFDGVHAPVAAGRMQESTAGEKEMVVRRLQDLGYM
jgi:arylsulfatase A-like enzyme